MFEPINISTPNIKNYNSRNAFERMNDFKTARPSFFTEAESSKEISRPGTDMPSQARPERPKEDLAGLHDVAVQYSIHEETGKTMIQIIDKESNEVIREIPSREDLERSAQWRTYVGKLFDAMA